MFENLKTRMQAFWRRVGPEQQTILVVSRSARVFRELRVLAIEQGWNIHFASSLRQAQLERPRSGVCVLLYDLEESWRYALDTVSNRAAPVIPIVLSAAAGPRLRIDVIAAGGYDVAQKPVDRAEIARLIRQAFALAAEVDACASLLLGPVEEYSNPGMFNPGRER